MTREERKTYEKKMKVQKIMLEVGKFYHAWQEDKFDTAHWVRLFDKRLERMMDLLRPEGEEGKKRS